MPKGPGPLDRAAWGYSYLPIGGAVFSYSPAAANACILLYITQPCQMLDLEAIGLQPVMAGPDGPPLDEEESVLHKFERLQLVIGTTLDQGEGTLYITEG